MNKNEKFFEKKYFNHFNLPRIKMSENMNCFDIIVFFLINQDSIFKTKKKFH